MSWIEIIHVRNSDSSLPDDISIHLCWSCRLLARDGSMIGKRIAYQFQQHTAAVRHSVWTVLEDLTS